LKKYKILLKKKHVKQLINFKKPKKKWNLETKRAIQNCIQIWFNPSYYIKANIKIQCKQIFFLKLGNFIIWMKATKFHVYLTM
jgi:hypothetical protein